jgi:hypothetical protein
VYGTILVLPPNSLLPFVILGWALSEEPGVTSHRVHDVSFGVIFLLAFVGLLAQFRTPREKVLPMLQALIPIIVLIVVETAVAGFDPELMPLYGMFGLPPLLLAALHPSRRQLVRPPTRPSRLLLGLAIVVAIPLLVFATSQVLIGGDAEVLGAPVYEQLEQLPETATFEEFDAAFTETIEELGLTEDDRVYIEHGGHWTAMAAWAIGLVVLALLVGLRVPGFRLSGWSVGAAIAYFGIVSLATPDDASSAGLGFGIGAILWGLVFIVSTEIERRRLPDADAPSQPALTSFP